MKQYKYWKIILLVCAFIAFALSVYLLIDGIMLKDKGIIFRRSLQAAIFGAYIIYYFYQRKKQNQNT